MTDDIKRDLDIIELGLGSSDFVEVYVSTPKAACIDRDKDGAWAKA